MYYAFNVYDQASENQPCGHIDIFEEYKFKIFNATYNFPVAESYQVRFT